jgi:DNA-binding SARP family transcriptional activator
VEFRILGPLEVVDSRDRIAVPAAKPRTMLAVLLLNANEVVSYDRLMDELWGDRRPLSARKLIQTYVGKLRSALGADLIETRPSGYRLQPDEPELDVARFRRLVTEARRLNRRAETTEAAGVYCEALALWRGPALADIAFESFAAAEVARLDEERFVALSERIDCELRLGQHDELVPELETLVKTYPLRERLRAQLMLALYRSGRQAEALDVYAETRRVMRDELGLVPSPVLQDLEREILRHDPKLEPTFESSRPDGTRPPRLTDARYAALLSNLARELGDFGQTDDYADAAAPGLQRRGR